jgi:hypothetical protein
LRLATRDLNVGSEAGVIVGHVFPSLSRRGS